jgi:integrase
VASKFSKLTRVNIRKLPAGGMLMEHGVIFKRLESGDGRYTVNIMVDGQRIHRVIGKESEGVTRRHAEDFVQQARTDARAGRLNLPRGRKTVLGFREAAQKYLDKLALEGGRDLVMKRRRLTQHLIPFFKDKSLTGISSFDVDRYKKFRLEGSTKPGTVNRELAALSHLFTKAMEWRWITHKPATIRRLKEDKGRITYLTTDQAARLVELSKQDWNPHVHPFIVIGLETSMRRMEILSIRLEHIDLQRRVIYIPQAKAGAREQPITSHLAEFLKGYLEAASSGQEWLFPAPKSRTGHVVAIEKAFRRVATAAGFDPAEVVRHTLRHTAITHLVQAGVDLPTVKRISGHKTLAMVERYSHQNGEHIYAAMDTLEKRYRPDGKLM